jgi:hypothetical protein
MDRMLKWESSFNAHFIVGNRGTMLCVLRYTGRLFFSQIILNKHTNDFAERGFCGLSLCFLFFGKFSFYSFKLGIAGIDDRNLWHFSTIPTMPL